MTLLTDLNFCRRIEQSEKDISKLKFQVCELKNKLAILTAALQDNFLTVESEEPIRKTAEEFTEILRLYLDSTENDARDAAKYVSLGITSNPEVINYYKYGNRRVSRSECWAIEYMELISENNPGIDLYIFKPVKILT